MTSGYCLYETAIGWGGVAWSDLGISGVQLPEADETRVRARLRRRFPDAHESTPPADVERAIQEMRKVLGGEPRDLNGLQLDLERVPEFARRVYDVARGIAFGETLTYGEIARRLGDVHLARDVGQALARNPCPIIVPCHRVLAADGKLGGFSAAGGVATKQRLLEIERANAAWQMPLLTTPS